MNARQAAQLARQVLLREDPYPEAELVLEEVCRAAQRGETSTHRRRPRVPARKRLAIVAELRAQGYEAWVSAYEEGARTAEIMVVWSTGEDF